mgnify:CR=1 FL=1
MLHGYNEMELSDIEEMRRDICNLKKANELMLMKLLEFLEETGKLTLDDFPILLNKIKQISEQLSLIGQEPTTTATRTKMNEAE